tara:strand:+ start:1296 stop:2030 length:735 start_codon:yes stop_codon:yes gene_type:complete
MPISLTPIPSSDPITPAILNDMFEKIEEFINGELAIADLQTSSAWVNKLEVVKPEFYGSPSPRALMPSVDVHYRRQFDKTYSFISTNDVVKSSIPIPALSATIHTPKESEDPATLLALFHCNFFCFESFVKRGTGNAPLFTNITHLKDDEVENTQVLAAYYELYVNDVLQVGTRRDLYWNFGNIAAKNHSISALITLNPGVNNVSVRVFPKKDTQLQTTVDQRDIKYYQIFTQTRNMIIDVMYR